MVLWPFCTCRYYQQSQKKNPLTLSCSRTGLALILHSPKEHQTPALVFRSNPPKRSAQLQCFHLSLLHTSSSGEQSQLTIIITFSALEHKARPKCCRRLKASESQAHGHLQLAHAHTTSGQPNHDFRGDACPACAPPDNCSFPLEALEQKQASPQGLCSHHCAFKAAAHSPASLTQPEPHLPLVRASANAVLPRWGQLW